MKTKKLINGIGILMLLCAMLTGFSVQDTYGQEEVKEKKVRVKVIKNEDGVYTEIDTSFDMPEDVDIEKIINISEFEGDLATEIQEKLKEITLEMDIIGVVDDELTDSIIECRVITKCRTKDDGDENTILIKRMDSDTKVMKDCEGIFITNPGGNQVVDIYLDDLEAEYEGKIINDSIKVICIKTLGKDEDCDYKVVMDCIKNLDHDSLIRTIEVRMDEAKIMISTKVMILDIEQDEIEELKDSGVQIATNNKRSLDIEDLDFYPNPSTGQFKLSFSLENKGDTDIKIYDMSGREVYSEKLKDFSGSYDKSIDISENANGTYFLSVSQGKEAVVKKIILQ